jgi:hypothetical protein
MESVWILTSETYGEGEGNRVVGVFASRSGAQLWKDHAMPPVTDGVIIEHGVE